MFSGIVAGLEKAKKIRKENGLPAGRQRNMVVELPIPKGWKLKIGDSINIDGICSTVQGLAKASFNVFYMRETLSKTTLGNLDKDHLFNLEKSLTLNDVLGGHMVSGHVDTRAQVINIKDEGDTKTIKFRIDNRFTKYIIYKGSIAVNGVSLTIVEVEKDFFSVSLIPYTLKHTNLSKLKVSDKVNIEVDLMAKYIAKLIKLYK